MAGATVTLAAAAGVVEAAEEEPGAAVPPAPVRAGALAAAAAEVAVRPVLATGSVVEVRLTPLLFVVCVRVRWCVCGGARWRDLRLASV
jgi:hypothetical protein